MSTIVAYFAIIILSLGVLLLIAPALILDYIRDKADVTGFRVTAVSLRVILGAVLLVLADASRFPLLITLLGALSLVSGIALALLPRNTFVRMIRTLTDMPSALARIGGIGAAVLGWFMIYAVL